MKCPWWKRFCGLILLLYAVFYLAFFLFNLISIHPKPGRNFTKKELFEGPLLKRYQVPNHKEKGIKAISGVFVVQRETSLDQSIATDHKFQSFNASSALPEISKEFLTQVSAKAKEISDREGQLPLFTLINSAYKELTLNWLCNVAEFNNTLNRTIIVSTSELFCRRLKTEWKEVTCLSLRLGEEYEGAFEWRHQQYINILTIRAQIMLHLIKDKLPFILFETDAIWLKDPTSLFENQTFVDDADLVVPTKGYTHKGDTFSFDPMIVYSTEATQSLFNEMVNRLTKNRRIYDQDVLEELCKTQHNGVVCRQFDWSEIADGKWFKLSENERLQYRPFIVNNNYYVGAENKMARQAINGLWFLSKMQRCVAMKVRKALKKYN